MSSNLYGARTRWIFAGGLFTLLLTLAPILWGVTFLAPTPFYLIVAYWTLPPLVALLPALYMGSVVLTFRYGAWRIVLLVVALVLSALSVAYLYRSWDNGLRYQGGLHTKLVILENAVGWFAVVCAGTIANVTKSRYVTLVANLLLFAVLAWCAFPYLGELP